MPRRLPKLKLPAVRDALLVVLGLLLLAQVSIAHDHDGGLEGEGRGGCVFCHHVDHPPPPGPVSVPLPVPRLVVASAARAADVPGPGIRLRAHRSRAPPRA